MAEGVPFLWNPVTRIAACGNWAGDSRVEAAFDSGEALAHAITAAGDDR
jgi:predicted NAD/FAD-dependent oxidoreductase